MSKPKVTKRGRNSIKDDSTIASSIEDESNLNPEKSSEESLDTNENPKTIDLKNENCTSNFDKGERNGKKSKFEKLMTVFEWYHTEKNESEDLYLFGYDMRNQYRLDFLKSIAILITSILLYVSFILWVSFITIIFVASLDFSEYMKTIAIISTCFSLLYVIILGFTRLALENTKINDELWGVKNTDSYAKILWMSQRNQFMPILSIALAWLAFIGLKM